MLNEVRSVLSLDRERAWKPPIVLTEAMRGENVPSSGSRSRSTARSSSRRACSRSGGGSNLAGEVFAVASARAKAHLERAVADDPELRRLLDEVQSRELDPLTAVREIMEKVFKVRATRRSRRPALTSRRRARGSTGVARVTPVYGSETLSRLTGREVLLKAENLQRTGSFKIRGAVNKIATLDRARARGRRRRRERRQPRPGRRVGGARGRRSRRRSSCRRTRRWRRSRRRRTTAREVELVGATFDEALAAALAHVEDDRRHVRPPVRGRARDRRPGDDRARARRAGAGGRDGRRPGRRRRARVGIALALRALRPELRIVGVQARRSSGLRRSPTGSPSSSPAS